MKAITVRAAQIPLCSSDALSHGEHQLLLFSEELAATYQLGCSPRDSAIQLYPCLFDTDELESEDKAEEKATGQSQGMVTECHSPRGAAGSLLAP